MITQDVKNPRLKGVGGILLIVAIMAIVFFALAISNILKPFIGALASTISVWAVGCLVALYVMRRYVVEFRYSADARRFRVERIYGDRARFMVEIPLNAIVKTGAPEEIRAAYPDAGRENATLRDATLETVAIAYKTDGAIRILLAQPDERMRKRLGMK